MKEKNKLSVTIWFIGLLGGLLFGLLIITGRIRFSGYLNLVKLLIKLIFEKRGLIVIYRHPSLVEPSLLPFLFFPWYLFSSKFIPISTPDKKNYYNKWWFRLFRKVCIPIERGNPEEERRVLKQIKRGLDEERIFLLAPGGGRESKGAEFKIIQDGKIIVKSSEEIDFIELGKAIRRFQEGISFFILNTNALVLPVWTEGGEKIILNKPTFEKFPWLPRVWKSMRWRIGQPLISESFRLKEVSESKKEVRRRIVGELEDTLLKLGER